MSSADLKRKLKAARDALDKKDFQSAHDTSLKVLEYEPENYFAYVPLCAAISHFDTICSKIFYGMSLLELGRIDQSEQVTALPPVFL